MLERRARVAVWTEDGRNDQAADVGLLADADGSVRIVVDAPTTALTSIAVRWDEPWPVAARVLGDAWERGYGDLEWRGIVAERTLPWYALVYDSDTGVTHGLGVDTGAASFASWRVDAAGTTLVLDLRCGGRGVRLGSRQLHAATTRELVSAADETPFALAQRLCRTLCPMPRLPDRPIYGGNDWYFRYGAISAETVRRDAALIRDLSPSLDNEPCFVIDAGWFAATGVNGGPYDQGNAQFPNMANLAGKLRANSVRPGIWIRPLLTTEDVPLSWRVASEHPRQAGPGIILDPSVPDVLAHIGADVARLRDWGYQVIKHDFSTYDITGQWGFAMGAGVTAGNWAFADRSRTTAEIVRALYATIRETAGEVILIGCNTVGHLGAGLFELQRTGDDTSGRFWERTRKMGVNTLAFRMPQHGTFFAADADCVGLTAAVPWDKNRLWLDLLARSGTPLFVSADPAALGAEQQAALRVAFAQAAVPALPGEPLDWLGTTCPQRWRFGTEEVAYAWDDFAGAAFACPP